MRSWKFIAALAAAAGVSASTPAFAGATVTPDILQGSFFFNDQRVGPDHCSNVEIDGITHQVLGVVTGIGTNDDTVTLTYTTPFPDAVEVRNEAGSVRERVQAQLDVDIQPGPGSTTPAYTGSANPERGRVTARVVKAGLEARVIASFKLGSDLSGLTPAPDAAQRATMEAAFQGRDDVKLNASKGKLALRQEGLTAFVCAPPAPPAS